MRGIREYVKMAVQNIRSNKGRSVLTMLGIIIGIASVIMVVSIGNSAKGTINDELNGIAGGELYVYVNSDARTDTALTLDDIEAIRDKIAHVKDVTMSIGGTGTAKGGIKDTAADISGGTTGLLYVSKEEIMKGKYFTESDVLSAKKVCVITDGGARKLFGNTDCIGMDIELTLDGVSDDYTVIGIKKQTESKLLNMMNGQDSSITVEIPYTSLGSSFQYYTDQFWGAYIMASDPKYSSQIVKDTVNLMEGRKNVRGQGIYQVESFEDEMGQINSILGYVTVFVMLVAAISLIVGGIGVMNIMLVSVSERTREIGIRKALGAKTRSIMLQFLSESAIITLIGGIVGIVIGVSGALIVCLAVGFTPHVQAATIVGATVFSCGVGIVFGVYPAKKAAKLSPIEALRHE